MSADLAVFCIGSVATCALLWLHRLKVRRGWH
jgi:hypothetical protein